MSTKDYYLPDKQSFGEPLKDQFNNLNLNQNNYQSLHGDNEISKSVINDRRKLQNYDFTDLIDLKAKRNSNSWNKSNKNLSSSYLNLYRRKSEEQNEFKNSKNANNSTLSLHIAAYENSIETDSDDGASINKGEILKQDFIDSLSIVQNPFEFSRQQEEDRDNHPEIMQFKASRRLLNPNEDSFFDLPKKQIIVFSPKKGVMFRRGRYQTLRDAEEEDENNRLEFVGTSSELVSPHFQRRAHQTPSYNPYEHRQGAGKDVSKTPVTPTTTTNTATGAKSSNISTPKGIPSDDQLTQVIGILYFMSWTRKALKNYSNDIRKLYEIPLTERCFGKLGDGNNSTEESIENSDSRNAAKEIAKKLEKGYDVSETFTDLALIQKRVADALANPQLDLLETRAETPRHLISPVELASLSRLRTLVKMSGSWLKKTVDMEAWMERNQKTLIQHATEVACGLEFAVTAFNAVCVLGEVYGLEPVDRKSVKKDFIRYLHQYERPRLQIYNAYLDIPESVKVIEYIGKLEAQLNHHRTILHLIGSSTISLFQVILKSLPTEILETTTRSLREVAHKLPPCFRFFDDLTLSPFASHFLGTPPPNSIEFSFGDFENHSTTTEASTPIYPTISQKPEQHSRKSSVQSVKSDHTQRSGSRKSIRSPEVFSAQSNSTQRSSASLKSPPTARN